MDFDQTFKTALTNAGVLQSKLSQLANGSKPVLHLDARHAIKGTFGNGDWKYEAGVEGGASVQVFSSKSDKDTDAIFGAPPKVESPASRPLIHPTPSLAWLKYSLAWKATAKAGTRPGPARLAFSGQANASLGAYCPAPADTTLAVALRQQAGIPLVFDVGDVRGLAVGQAVYVALGGKLSAKLEFNWADVLTRSLKPLQALASGDAPVNLSIDLKAGFAAEFTISDSFRLVFLGVDKDYVTVSLNRASSNAFSVIAGVNAVIKLEKPDMARDVLAGLVAQLLGVDRSKLAAARAQLEKVLSFYDEAVETIRSEIGDLAGKLDAAIDAQGLPSLLTRLEQLQALAELADGNTARANPLGATVEQIAKAAARLDTLADRLETEVGDKLDALLASLKLPTLAADSTKAVRGLMARIEKIESALLAIARERIEVGVSFEYRRIASDATVLRARLRRDHDDFASWHGSLLALDARRVLEASSPTNKDVILDLFLNAKSIKRSLSLGLDLGWFYTDKDEATLAWTSSERMVSGKSAGAPLSTERRRTLKGTRSREEKTFGSVARCSGQFDADFLASGDPGATGNWNFALALSFASTVSKADRPWLLALADYAAVWGVIEEIQIPALIKTLEDDGAIGSKVEVQIGYTLDQAAWATPALFNAISKVSDADVARALAIALQRIEGYPGRAMPSAREATYAEAVKVLLGKLGIDVTKPAPVAKYVSRQMVAGSVDLIDFEINERIWPGSVASIVKRSGSLLGAFREFRFAGELAPLAGVQTAGDASDRKRVESAFKGLDLAWRDRILLRWQVTLLRQLVARAGLASASGSTMKVIIGSTGKARIF